MVLHSAEQGHITSLSSSPEAVTQLLSEHLKNPATYLHLFAKVLLRVRPYEQWWRDDIICPCSLRVAQHLWGVATWRLSARGWSFISIWIRIKAQLVTQHPLHPLHLFFLISSEVLHIGCLWAFSLNLFWIHLLLETSHQVEEDSQH